MFYKHWFLQHPKRALRWEMKRSYRFAPSPIEQAAALATVRWQYAFGLLLALVSIYVRFLLRGVLRDDAPLMVSIIGVAIAAWYGGLGPGVVASVVSCLGGVLLFLPPVGTHESLNPSHAVRLFLFLLTGVVISLLTEALQTARTAWQQAQHEQETRVLEERNRIAREIHDTLAHGLTGIIIQLEAAEDSLQDDVTAAEAHIGRAGNLARTCLAEARRSVQALRPQMLEHDDLLTALRYHLEQMTAGTGVAATLEVNGRVCGLYAEVEDNLLRIALEATTNALKHARANHIQVDVTFRDGSVCLSVRDDGCGFVPRPPSSPSGFGLTGMWERTERLKGQFSLTSSPGTGTTVAVTVPLVTVATPTGGDA